MPRPPFFKVDRSVGITRLPQISGYIGTEYGGIWLVVMAPISFVSKNVPPRLLQTRHFQFESSSCLAGHAPSICDWLEKVIDVRPYSTVAYL